ncbi:hypothetical protein U9M48_038953 [Paspalum notatum var. saurae]|uniref:Uncharacterized protein n=1 Tax=Paspalum notatum var. saurae TaxID=547442 RepID=A0AAQ3XBK7_PASNO
MLLLLATVTGCHSVTSTCCPAKPHFRWLGLASASLHSPDSSSAPSPRGSPLDDWRLELLRDLSARRLHGAACPPQYGQRP